MAHGFSIFEYIEPGNGSRRIILIKGICDDFEYILLGVEAYVKLAVVVLGLDDAIHFDQSLHRR